MKINNPTFRRTVVALRIGAPMAFVCAICLGSLAWSNGSYGLVTINAFLAGVSAVLTWVEWQVFEI
jgi:hypothetical protein